MPELPEVESVRRCLVAELPGRRIEELWTSPLRMRRAPDVTRLRAVLLEKRFIQPARLAKYLLLGVDSGHTLMIHLGMSGRLLIQPRGQALLEHTHLRLSLDSGRELRLVDPRRFGFYDLLEAGAVDPSLAELGLDPLTPDFPKQLSEALGARVRAVRALLLDQRVVAGLGNIYVTEALWGARIHPRALGSQLSERRRRHLGEQVQAVLADALEAGGTTLRDYRSPDGAPGFFAVSLSVYAREGAACPRCGQVLRRWRDAGRSSFVCPRCQRK